MQNYTKYYDIENLRSRPRILSYLNDLEDSLNVFIDSNRKHRHEIKVTGSYDDVNNAIRCIKSHEENYNMIQEEFEKIHLNKQEKNNQEIISTLVKYDAYQEFRTDHFTEDAIRRTIGKKGYFFIDVTEDCGINGIWHNKERGVIEFWGDFKGIKEAKMKILSRLNFYNKQKGKYHFKNVYSVTNELQKIY